MSLIPLPCAVRRGFALVLGLILVSVAPGLRAQSAADGFNPNVSGSVQVVVRQPDGKLIIGGSFVTIAPNNSSNASQVSGLARLNLDGSIDTSFTVPSLTNPSNQNLPSQVQCVVLQDDGKILVGGTTQINGGQKYLFRLNSNGTQDTSFAPVLTGDVNGAVSAITYVPGATVGTGNILIGGNFTAVNGSTSSGGYGVHAHVARLSYSGVLDDNWKPQNVNAQVDAIAVQPGTNWIILGGAFVTVGPGTPATAANPNPAASTLPPTHNHICRVDTTTGAVDPKFDPNADNQVNQIVIQQNGQILIGGAFNTLLPLQPDGSVPSTASTATFIARLNPDGTIDTTWSTQLGAAISQILIAPTGQIYVCGSVGTITSGGTNTMVQNNVARLNPDGSPDGTWFPAVNAQVFGMALQPDGKLVIGGIFTQVTSGASGNGTPRFGMARLDRDGILDADFNPNAFGGIGVIVQQPDGKYLVGGSFTSIGGVTVRNFARLNTDGSVDTTFLDPNPDLPVSTILIVPKTAGGTISATSFQIIIGGTFTQMNSNDLEPDLVNREGLIPWTYLARLYPDGSLDKSWQPEPDGKVTCLLLSPDSNSVLVGGSFSEFTPATVTGTTLLPITLAGGGTATTGAIGTNTTSTVTGDPVVLSNLARVKLADGTVDTTFEPNPDAEIDAMVIDQYGNSPNQYVIVGGSITSVTPAKDSVTSLVTGLARLNLTDGRIDTTWEPNPSSSTIYGLAQQKDGKLLVAGALATFTPIQTPVDPVTHVAPSVERHGLARINKDGTIDTAFNPDADGAVYTVGLDPNAGTSGQAIYVGGRFKNINGQPQSFAARLNPDGTLDQAFRSTFNGPINTVIPVTVPSANDQFVMGGAFTLITAAGATSGVQENHLARFNGNGTLDTTFALTGKVATGGSLGASINAIALESNGEVIVGGNFENAAGTFASNIVRFLDDGSFDSGFAADATGTVNSVVIEANGSSIYAGGNFSSIGGYPAYGIARINDDGTADNTFNLNANVNVDTGGVFAIAPQTDGNLLIGGNFNDVDGEIAANKNFHGVVHNNLARLLNSGLIDLSFNANTDGQVDSIVVLPAASGTIQQQILIGGKFTTIYNGTAVSGTRTNLARLNADGTLDTSFNANIAGGQVNAIALQSDGSILIGGTFTTVNGVAQANLARLTASGTLDTSFNVAVNGQVNAIVLENGSGNSSFTIAPNGVMTAASGTATTSAAPNTEAILLGGAFTSVGGQTRNHAARLVPSGSALIVDPNYNPNVDQTVNAMAIDTGGKTYLGGSFASVGGLARSGLARVTATGISTSTITTNSLLNSFTWTLTGEVPELNAVIFQTSADGLNFNTVGAGTRVGTGNSWTISGVTNVPNGVIYVRTLADAETTQFGSQSEVQGQQQFYGTPQAVIQSAGTATAVANQTFYYEVAATNSPTSYVITGLPPGVQYNAGLGIIYGTPTATGTYTVKITVNNANPTSGSGQIVITVVNASTLAGKTTTPQTRLLNLSARATVSPSTILVEGLTISGTGPKNVLLRAIGPSLGGFSAKTDIQSWLSEPILTLFNSGSYEILQAQGWDNSNEMRLVTAMVGAFPISAGQDTSTATVLSPGSNSFWVTSGAGDTGVALAEIYDADPNPYNSTSRLTNLSSQGLVDTIGDQLFGGFVIGGTGTKQVLLRGIGPGLGNLGVANSLGEPILTVYDSKGNVIASNTEWDKPNTANSAYPAASAAAITAACSASGAFAMIAGQSDTAVLLTLPPGVYSMQVSTPTADAESGTAMIEIYEIPGT